MMSLFDEEQIMKSFIKSERYEAAQDKAKENSRAGIYQPCKNKSLLGIVLLGGNKMQADEFVLKRIEELSKKYQETWGKEVDYTIVPQGITQERLTKCLELMIKDNLSLMIAYNKLFKK